MTNDFICLNDINFIQLGESLFVTGVSKDLETIRIVDYDNDTNSTMGINVLNDAFVNNIKQAYFQKISRCKPSFEKFFLDVMTEVSKALATTDKPLDIRISTDPFNEDDSGYEIHSEIYSIDIDSLKDIYYNYILNEKIEYVSIEIYENSIYDKYNQANETDYFVEYKFSSIGEPYEIHRKGEGFHSVK